MTTRRTKPEAEAGFACSHTRSALTCSARVKPLAGLPSTVMANKERMHYIPMQMPER